jgi:hypothetical protein
VADEAGGGTCLAEALAKADAMAQGVTNRLTI